jgi:hypothetical protein
LEQPTLGCSGWLATVGADAVLVEGVGCLDFFLYFGFLINF